MAKKTAVAKAPEPALEVSEPERHERMGRIVRAPGKFREWVDGVAYDHVADVPDGRWVYAPS